MKILFVTDLYPIGEENISKALYYFVREWQKEGHEVDILRSNYIINTIIRGRKIQKEKIYYENGTKIYNLNFHTPFLFNVYNKLPKDFSLKNYDVMISHMPSGALMANKLLKKEKIKYICSVHASDIVVLKNIKYSIYFRQQLKKAYMQADKVSARSYVLQTKIEEIMPEIQDKTFVAFSGLDNEFIQNEQSPKYFNQEELQISTVSSLINRKNTDIIIKALSMISNKFHLTVMGDGIQKKRLEKLAKKLNIEEKITFTGVLPRNKVIDNLKKSDIFILISNNETFGLVYLEAMAAGNIIIAKKNDGIDGILKNEQNAFLIEPEILELKKCLEKITAMKETEINIIKQNAADTAKKLTSSMAAENYLKNIQ
ncbi:MAG: glycosyltransferase [Candidatus Gastranaerophilales bacterium]|nr:glycosyltransferase [Candidatus Gastranaerophilales bacterium]